MGPLSRRTFAKLAAATLAGAGVGPLAGCAAGQRGGRVVVVGGGFGGATAARYLRRINPRLDVTLVEPKRAYVTCPFSNTVLGGFGTLAALTRDYGPLSREGVVVVHETVRRIDATARKVHLSGGDWLAYDRLILAPGIDLLWDSVPGYSEPAAQRMPHAWKAGPQTLLLARQIDSMADGGLVVIAVPKRPYRCPPAPYERASLIAYRLKHTKPRAKVLILDANDGFEESALFTEGWSVLYPGLIEWVRASQGGTVTRVDPQALTLETAGGTVQAQVANVIPRQAAGSLARQAGLAGGGDWCAVDPLTFESRKAPGIHVIGDSADASPMPKSGFAANGQAKVCAMAVAALLAGDKLPPPYFMNACYSFLHPDYAVSAAGVFDVERDRIHRIPGAGGLSPLDAPESIRRREAHFAQGWYDGICDDVWGPRRDEGRAPTPSDL